MLRQLIEYIMLTLTLVSHSHLVSEQKGLGVKLNIRSWDPDVISRILDKIDMSKRELFK